ncbi:MAG: hypothetical protein WDZ51_08980 [Pirellulaceae bacterium]
MNTLGKASLLWASIVVVLGTTAGCETSSEAKVSGEVTLGGVPLENGTISFIPTDEKTPTAGGRISAGKYSLVVPPGSKRVEILATKVTGQRAAYEGQPDSPMIDITESIIPERYNKKSELTFEMEPGLNQKDFALDN